MYSRQPSFVLGFHGCDITTQRKILIERKPLELSTNDYDWLGHGIYFWENDPRRALEYAKQIKEHPERCINKINTPAVVGAIIDLGYCLNLFERESLELVKEAYKMLKIKKSGFQMPRNISIGKEKDVLIRNLDCAVIETLHEYNKENNKMRYDTVRCPFFEGKPLYRNAGFSAKNHIQICVLNHDCIKGYFYPMELAAV